MTILESFRQLLTDSFGEFLQTLAAWLPNLIITLLILVSGWLFASIIRGLIVRFGGGIDRLSAKLRHHPAARTNSGRTASGLIASTAYWLVLIFFIAAGVKPLGLPGLADWISHFILFLPKLLVGLVIVVGGFFLAGLAQEMVRSAVQVRSEESAEALSLATRGLVIAFAIILGVSQLGLDITLLVNVATIAAAAIFGGLGLAFGLGARAHVSNVLASQHLRKIYRVGQRVRIADIEGEILELTATAVLLNTAEGQARIPAKVFNDQAAVLITGEEPNA